MKLRALVLVVVSALIAAPLAAAPKPKNKAKTSDTKGKAEFEKGMRFFKAQEYEAAYIYLLKAYELSGKRPSAIRALAQCERSLKRYDEAIAHFREYLATTPKPADSKAVEETIVLLQEVAAAEREKAAPPVAAKPPVAAEKPPPAAKPAEKQASIAPPPAPVETRPAPPAAVLPPPPPPEEEAGGVLSSPVFWAVVGGAVVAGGAVALGVGLSGEREPYAGSSGIVLRGP